MAYFERRDIVNRLSKCVQHQYVRKSEWKMTFCLDLLSLASTITKSNPDPDQMWLSDRQIDKIDEINNQCLQFDRLLSGDQ